MGCSLHLTYMLLQAAVARKLVKVKGKATAGKAEAGPLKEEIEVRCINQVLYARLNFSPD